jgi:hypothetical protein
MQTPPAAERGVSSIPRYGSNRTVIGLPARAVVITNSERGDAACDLRWYYGQGLGLGSVRKSTPLSFGSAAHLAMEDVWGWWARTDADYDAGWLETCVWCALQVGPTPGVARDPVYPGAPCHACNGTTLGPVPRAIAQWEADRDLQAAAFGAPDEDEDEDLPRRAERLRRVLTGYLRVNGTRPPGDLRVISVETTIARPILGPTGKPYAPEVPLFRDDDGGYRFARPGDDPTRVKMEKLPWYFLGTVDALLASRNTGMLFVGEHKFSKQPETFLHGLTNDPQTAAYCWTLDAVKDDLDLPPEIVAAIAANGGKRKVGGYLYMVNASSFQYDPEPLKAGGLSQAKNRTVPSWRYEAALAVAQAGTPGNPKLASADYADHIADLKVRIDPRLYRRESGSVGPIERARFGVEVYGIATRHAKMRREVWLADGSKSRVLTSFPRTPVCRQAGGFCSFRGPCASATFDPAEIVGSGAYVVSDGQRWFPDGSLPLPSAMVRPSLPADPVPSPTSETDTQEPPCLF